MDRSTYRLYGRNISTPFELRGVPRAESDATEWTYGIGGEDALRDDGVEWFHLLDAPPGAPPMRFGEREGGQYVVTMESGSAYAIDVAAHVIEGHGVGRLDSSAAMHELCDLVVPLALATSGDFVMHAAAVVKEGEAFAFAGPSGSGKSSLAATLVDRGWQFFSDDALRLELEPEVVAWPGYPSVRLWPDSVEAIRTPEDGRFPVRPGGDKMRIAMVGSPAKAERLARLFVLAEGDAIAVEPLSLQDAVLALARSTFRLDFRDHRAMAGEFRAVERLITEGLIWRLTYPRRYDLMDEVATLMEGARKSIRRQGA